MIMDDRKRMVLSAIVNDYIATAEPVGSRTIVKKYKLGVSPATVRNEMADLEELGYIQQPHTSAGRIPSERGYRYYVDYLMRRQGLTGEEEALIRREYDSKVRDIGQVIQRTGQLLSQLTKCAAMVLKPQTGSSAFKHIHMVPVFPLHAIVIVVMDTGTVHNRMIDLPESITPADLETVSHVLNAKLQGLTIEKIKLNLIKEIYFELVGYRHFLDLAIELIQDSLSLKGEDKVYLGGIFNILNQPEFHNVERVKTLLSLLDQEEQLCDLLAVDEDNGMVNVRIGGEINHKNIRECSIVTATYRVGNRVFGSIGVLGPTRMEYAKVIGIVDFMRKGLSQALESVFHG